MLRFGKETPTDVRSLMRMIAEYPLDGTNVLTIRRKGADMEVPITIGEYPAAMMDADFPLELSTPPRTSGNPGLRLEPLGADARRRWHLPADAAGVEVREVPAGSAVDRAGLLAGDVILQIQGKTVDASDKVLRDIRQAQTRSRKEAALLIVGPDGQQWVAFGSGATER